MSILEELARDEATLAKLEEEQIKAHPMIPPLDTCLLAFNCRYGVKQYILLIG